MSISQPNPTPLRPVTSPPLRREQPIERAARLISDGAVTLQAGAKVYSVKGDHGTYRVIADPDGIQCPCEARTSLCAHVLAVAAYRLRGKPVPERLARDLGLTS